MLFIIGFSNKNVVPSVIISIDANVPKAIPTFFTFFIFNTIVTIIATMRTTIVSNIYNSIF